MRIVTAVLALGLVLPGSPGALANLQCSQLRIIVPFSAGGATDVSTRLVAERLEASLKKSVVIENRPGATGNIGSAAVASAAPDGCTLLTNAAVIATFGTSFSKLPFDPMKDLIPIGGIGMTPTLLVTAAANPPSDMKSLMQWGKDKGGINYSTAGYGLLQHLAIEEIAQRSGGKFVHITYKGGSQAAVDLVAARVDLGSFAAGSVLPMVRDGKLKAIANVAEKRSSLAPEVPTTTEQGLPGLDAGVQFMIYAPGATPKPVVELLSSEVRKIVGDPAMKDRFIKIGFDPTPTSSEDMVKLMRKTQADWTPLIKKLNIRLD